MRPYGKRNKMAAGICTFLIFVAIFGIIISNGQVSFSAFDDQVEENAKEKQGEEFDAELFGGSAQKKDTSAIDKNDKDASQKNGNNGQKEKKDAPDMAETTMEPDPGPNDDKQDKKAQDVVKKVQSRQAKQENKKDKSDAKQVSVFDNGSAILDPNTPAGGDDTKLPHPGGDDLHTGDDGKPTASPGTGEGDEPTTTPIVSPSQEPVPDMTPEPTAEPTPEPTPTPIPVLERVTVSGTLSHAFSKGHKLTSEDFKNIHVIAVYSDDSYREVPYNQYSHNVTCASTGKREAVFSYQGMKSDDTISYEVLRYKVVLDIKGISGNGNTLGDRMEEVEADGERVVNLLPWNEWFQGLLEKEHIYEKDSVNGNRLGNRFAYWEKEDGTAFESTITLPEGVTELHLYPHMEANNPDYIIKYSNGVQALIGYIGTSSVINIPKGVTCCELDGTSFELGDDTPAITRVNIPNSVTDIVFATGLREGDRLGAISYINVNEGNARYSSRDGVMYSADGRTLLHVPYAMPEMPGWHENCVAIGAMAFAATSMQSVDIPEKVVQIGMDDMNADGEGVFINAAASVITIRAVSGLKLGANLFFEEGKTYILHSVIPPEIKNYWLSESAPVIVVPDSPGDKIYKEYLMSWAPRMLGVKARRAASGEELQDYLTTALQAGKRYLYDADEKIIQNTAGDSLERVNTELKDLFQIPDGMKNIADGAFDGCDRITMIEVPDSVERICEGAFAGMASLGQIQMSSLTPPELIGAQSGKIFGEELPDGMRIFVPESDGDMVLAAYIKEWGSALDEAYGQGTAVKVLASLSGNYEVVDGAMYLVHKDGTRDLVYVSAEAVEVTVMDGTVGVLEDALERCKNLEILCLPDTIKKLSDRALAGCTSLRVLTCNAATAPELGEEVFAGLAMGQLEIDVPEGSVDAYRSWDNELTKQYGASVDSLQSRGQTYTLTDQMVWAKTLSGEKVVYYVSFHKEGELSYKNIMPTKLAPGHCAGRTAITAVTLICDGGEIGDASFLGCSGLKKVTVSYAPARWGEHIFTGCENISTLLLYGAGTTQLAIPEDFMAGNTALSSITIYTSGGVASIGARAFMGCSALTTVQYSSSSTAKVRLQEIGDDAFNGCTSLTTITWGSTNASIVNNTLYVKRIGDRAFKDCARLTKPGFGQWVRYQSGTTYYYMFRNLTEIGEECFAGCESMTTCYMPNFLTKIGSGAFRDCKLLKYVQIWGAVTEIPDDCFRGCISLVNDQSNSVLYSVACVNALQRIGARAFKDCTSMTDAPTWYTSTDYFGAFTEIGDEAFAGCENLHTYRIPYKVSRIGEGAFAGCPLSKLVFAGENPPELGGYVFGESPLLADDFAITLTAAGDTDAYKELYYNAWHEKLDTWYGEKTARWLDYIAAQEDSAQQSYLMSRTDAVRQEDSETQDDSVSEDDSVQEE